MKPHKENKHFLLPNVADIACMDQTQPPMVAEKVCKTVRLLGFLIQNGVSKSKVINDMQDVMKRGKNIGKALNNVVARQHEALTCRSRDAHMSFVSPLEYQFSCSGSPPRPSRAQRLSPANAAVHTRRLLNGRDSPRAHRVVGICGGNSNDTLVEHYRPVGRRVNITGSAASLLRETEKEFHVDEEAEKFIEKFHRELRLQKWLDHYYC
ncbi:hypothetical protein RIF29_12121 [Crotalaria pallida]|uniref:Uncharacterized protein n=1 Tax=Crotalaria pallida TaxID=3830 RepID=A0AAN9IMU8_CROPI